jgi:hypothetical protein
MKQKRLTITDIRLAMDVWVRKQVSNKMKVPPDPDGMNSKRAKWARKALETHMLATRNDPETVFGDLLADMIHFADRHGIDFKDEVGCALECHKDETTIE